jgi:hypothetical protein
MDEQLARAGRLLFYNPWCSRRVISALAGLDRSGQKQLEERKLFERLRVPRENAQGHQILYALTAGGQRAFTGRYRSPLLLAETLLMQYGRLDRARRGLVQLSLAGMLGWAISPWKATRSGPYFDALFTLCKGNSRALLAALSAPLPYAGPEWHLDLISAWRRFCAKNFNQPALLIFWNPRLSAWACEYLGRNAPAGAGCRVMVFHGEDLSADGEQLLLGPPGSARGTLWNGPPSLPENRIVQEEFIFASRRTPYRGGATLGEWAEKSGHPSACTLVNFLDTQKGALDLLEAIARYPGLSPRDHKYLDSRPRSQRKQAARMKGLLSAGLVEQTGALDGGCLATRSGLALLAGLAGLNTEDANRYLGWPVRASQFKEQHRHLKSVAEFMLRLKRERALVSWNFLASRARFLIVQPGEHKLRRMVIWPDSIGIVKLAPKVGALFWLEVDRGTRRGSRLEAKLEKYFLAHTALLATSTAPIIVYLVDTGSGQDEARLRQVSRTLEAIGRRYPGSPLSVLLGTGQLLVKSTGPIMGALLWRRYWKNAWNPGLISLRAGLSGKE